MPPGTRILAVHCANALVPKANTLRKGEQLFIDLFIHSIHAWSAVPKWYHGEAIGKVPPLWITMQFIPEHIREYLNQRGLTDAVLDRNQISWDGNRIVIPVFDTDGVWLFNKYRRDPAKNDGPKYTYDAGSTSQLYGIDKVQDAKEIIICEGELDSLILEAQGFVAVCSTGGAGTFREEWAQLLTGKDLYVCMDNDAAGDNGRARVTSIIPSIKSIPLPPEVGPHGDITDFFVKLGKKKEFFRALMNVATPLVVPEKPKRAAKDPAMRRGDDTRLSAAKAVPLSQFLKFNNRHYANCPFHNDKTPSLHWFGENRWHCFSCGEGGDVIDFIMMRDSCTMPQAIDTILTI